MREKKLQKEIEHCDDFQLNCYRLGDPKPSSLEITIRKFDSDGSLVMRAFETPFEPSKAVTISCILARFNQLVAKFGDFEVISISFDNFPF